MYIPWNEGLSPGMLFARTREKLPFPLQEEQACLFARARHALAAAITALDIRAGEKVLAPAYVCGTAIAPFQWVGIEVSFYPVDPAALRPLWPAVERMLAQNRARAFLLVHYFGLPSDPEEARAFCDRHGLLLIEDCAHSFLSEYRGRPLGSLGDAAIFSLRKLLPIPNGGALRLRHSDPPPKIRLAPRRTSPLVLGPAVGRYLAQTLGWKPPRLWLHGGRPGQPFPTREMPAPREPLEGINAWALRLLRCIDMERVSIRRRENYRQLSGALRRHRAIRLLQPELPEGACPQVLPVLMPDSARVAGALQRLGVHAYPWPALLKDMERASPTAAWLSRHMLALPVHQGLGPEQLRYIVSCFHRVCPPDGEPFILPSP